MGVRHIYIACSLSRAQEAVALAAKLEEYGHRIVSTWHTKENLDAIMNTENLKKQGDDAEASRGYHEVCASDLLIVFAMPNGVAFYSGGHTTEFGIALGRSTEVIAIGDRSNVFYHLPWVRVVADADLAVRAANG